MSDQAFKVQKLSQHIGAEVQGIDLSREMGGDVAHALHAAWLDHAVLLFRDQKLSQEDFLRVTSYFGTLAKLTRPAKFFPKGYSRLLPNIMMISNIRENGETIGALPDGEMHFHHDQIHSEIPHNGTLLYSLEIPTHGGDTLFASGYAAYDALDPETKKAIDGKRAHNFYNYGSTLRGKGGVEAHSEAVHPVVRTHEDTGRKALYVNRLMTRSIEGMPEPQSEKLLDKLFEHSERPEFVYRHKWRVGDLLIWDNRCSMHARDDFPSDQRRLMLRTTVEGTVRPY
ncbi:Taurine catabolism dioxygenase TauD/TfdA [Rhodoplanes sp. Z2-YC6860]|nr:Taurine catabolism dioxygenase TauD/TfdA [Rhodoplanes sp. Z2-YC6860]